MNEIKKRLEEEGYTLSLSKTHSKGRVRYHKGVEIRYNKDYYTLELSCKGEVLDLLEKLKLRHLEKNREKKISAQYDQAKYNKMGRSRKRNYTFKIPYKTVGTSRGVYDIDHYPFTEPMGLKPTTGLEIPARSTDLTTSLMSL